MRKTIALFILLVLSVAVLAWGSTSASNEKTAITAVAQSPRRKPNEPAWTHAAWMNKSLSADERADLVLKELTLDEKIDLLHGQGMPGWFLR